MMMRSDNFPLEVLAEEYLREVRAKRRRATYENHHYMLRNFLGFCAVRGIHTPNSLNRTAWLDYLSYLRDEGYSQWTLATAAKVVRAFVRWLHEEGFIRESPIRPKDFPAPPKPEPAPLSVVEMERLLDLLKRREGWIGKRDYALTITYLSTGLRRNEALQMTPAMVETGVVVVRQKGDRRLQTYLDEETLRAIHQYLRALYRETGYRPREDDRLWRDVYLRSLTPHAVDQIYRRVRKELGFRVHPHRLRATSISWRLELGASTELVRALVGHEHPQAIEHYARFNENEKRRLMEQTSPLKRLR